MIMSAARQRRYISRINADPHKRAEYLMKHRNGERRRKMGAMKNTEDDTT